MQIDLFRQSFHGDIWNENYIEICFGYYYLTKSIANQCPNFARKLRNKCIHNSSFQVVIIQLARGHGLKYSHTLQSNLQQTF